MKKLLGISAALLGMSLPLFAQLPAQSLNARATLKNAAYGWQDQDDRRRRDDDDDRNQNRGYGQYGRYGRNGQYQGVLAPEWQQKFDSYYQRWLQYRATNNQDEMHSMENRMYSIMDNYRIPRNVPFGAVASSGVGGNNGYYGRGGYGSGDNDADDRGGYNGNGNFRNGYHSVLAPEWQQKFDSYYQRWLQYRATNNQDEMRSMENRMRDIMTHYNIPPDAPFGEVASQNSGGGYYRR